MSGEKLFPIAERFQSPQGEGLFSGQQMAFMRTVGCSVGQKVCTACDTDFSAVHKHLGGGLYSAADLLEWAKPCRHICITGGEPLDRDLRPLLFAAKAYGIRVHIETSGTVSPDWLMSSWDGRHHVLTDLPVSEAGWVDFTPCLWITVSPKPGYRPDMIEAADEVKVIIGGLGNGLGWPTVKDALKWADKGKLVYVQPRNERNAVDRAALDCVLELVAQHPVLRLSTQLHKFLERR